MPETLSELIHDANADLNKPGQSFVVGAPDGETPRFELYHAPFSICSQKVRTVLMEKNVAFTSHHMNLPVSETIRSDSHRPSYVRLRLQGAHGVRMVSNYAGHSSVASVGFDPCVVPTLVDHLHQRVIVDSVKICHYIDSEVNTATRLIPDDAREAVNAQVTLTDEAPHPAVLYGVPPYGEDFRPEIVAIPITGAHTHALRHLEEFKESVADEPELVAAYDAAIANRSSARDFVYDRKRMIDAHAGMARHVADLEKQLGTHDGDWVMGDSYALADIMWSASLFRLKWLGFGFLWENPDGPSRVVPYVERAFMRPGFRKAVIDWPTATPPSLHIGPSAPYAQKLFPAWQKMRKGMSNVG